MLEEAPFIIIITKEGEKVPEIYNAKEYICDLGSMVFYGKDICEDDVTVVIDLSKRSVKIKCVDNYGDTEYENTYPIDCCEIRFNKNLPGKDVLREDNDTLYPGLSNNVEQLKP
jgi:Fe-S-cluster containining protein